MKKLIALLTVLLAFAITAVPVFAGEMTKEDTSATQMTGSSYADDELLNLTVINRDGEEIGKISNVSRDADTDAINFVTLATGGLFGVGTDSHIVPLNVLDISKDENRATLLVKEDLLENAPKITEGMSHEEFRGVIDKYYGVAPEWKDMAPGAEKMMEEKQTEKSGY